jgi:hypothetical protein
MTTTPKAIDHLVDAEEDGRVGHRPLHLAEDLAVGRAVRLADSMSPPDRSGCRATWAHRWGEGEDHGGDHRGGAPMSNSSTVKSR